MALFKTGILGEVSGKLHGIEFAQQAGRCVLKIGKHLWVGSTDHRKQNQLWLTQHNKRWADLTDDQRKAWGVWALSNPTSDRFGMKHVLSGFQAFMTFPHHLPPGLENFYQLNPPYLPWDLIPTATYHAFTTSVLHCQFNEIPVPEATAFQFYYKHHQSQSATVQRGPAKRTPWFISDPGVASINLTSLEFPDLLVRNERIWMGIVQYTQGYALHDWGAEFVNVGEP